MVRRGVAAVPAWPVIVISVEGDSVVADPAGVGDPVRVAVYPDHWSAATTAALAAARRLNVSRCRVQGLDPEGGVWLMVVDTEAGTLEELEQSAGKQAVPAGGGPLASARARLAGVSRQWWLVIGTATVAAVAVGVVLIPRAALPTPTSGGARPAAVQEEAPTPPAGQLPVPAPAGWDTYASWVVDVEKPGAAAVMVGRGTLVIVDGSDVIGLNASTGQLLWRSGTSGEVTELWVSTDQKSIYAARGNNGVSVLNAKTGAVLSNAETKAEHIGLADVPFAQLPGQAGAVLLDGEWERRQVPATAVPVGTLGIGLLSVSIEQRKMWLTTSDDAVLPAASEISAPAEGLRLSRVVTYVAGRLVTEWTDGRGSGVIAVDVIESDSTLRRTGTFESKSAGRTVSVDGAQGLIGIGSQLISVHAMQAVEAPEGSVVARAGFGWTEQIGDRRVRLSTDGAISPMATRAVIPDVLLPDGRAVVRAARGADGHGYYVLEEAPPAPTPQPSSTDGKGQ